MRALMMDRSRGIFLEHDAPDPVRPAGEALVEMSLAGICDTDLQLAKGYMDYVGTLGHEFVGRVRDADDARWHGKRVVADINAGCGECEDCRLRSGHHCTARTVLGIAGRGGALADYLVVPQACLVEVPDDLSDEAAVFAEPLAAAMHVLDEIEPATDRAIVIGDGKLGLLITLALVDAGLETTLIGHHREKLAVAKGARGLLPNEAKGAQAPLVVEASGSTSGLRHALELCSPRGTIVLKSTMANRHEIDLAPIVINEIKVVGSRCGSIADAVAAMSAKRIDPTPLIAARYPLARAERAVEHAFERGTLKVLVSAT